MKKLLLAVMLISLSVWAVAQEAVVFSADFEYWDEEGSEAFTKRGWTVIEDADGAASRDKWENQYSKSGKLSGKFSPQAGCWNKTSQPNEDWLITPEIKLTNPSAEGYALDFLWGNASVNVYSTSAKGNYTLLVKVREAGKEDWKTVFDIANKDMVEASGVIFPWVGWSTNHSVVDLSEFKGKTIQIGFCYHEFALFISDPQNDGEGYAGNSVSIDDVIVKEWTPLTSPIVETATKDYTFTQTYIGTSSASESISLKNVGIGELQVTSIDGLSGTDFSCTIVPGADKAKKNEAIAFKLIYTPTLTGAAKTDMTIHTNGGDVKISVSGQKIMIPEGYTYQGFEGPWVPAGWTTKGEAWRSMNGSFSGNTCAIGTTNVAAGEAWLISPRMDLSAGGTHTITFDFFDQYAQMGDNGYDTPDNWFKVEFSEDGGKTWTVIYDQDVKKQYNSRVRYKHTFADVTSDNCYVRFGYLMEDEIDYENIDSYEFSYIYLDDVVLPPLYGMKSAPGAATVVAPKDQAKDITNRRPMLKWNEVQFATSYKVYLGTADGKWDIIDGESTTELSMQAPRLNNNTTYYWRIIAVSAYGETAEAPVWSFRTMADQSVRVFPWFEGFETTAEKSLPLGWESTSEQYTRWELATNYSYEGKNKMLSFGSNNNTTAELISPEIVLPNSDGMQLSFFWGNGVTLTKEANGAAINTTTKADDIDAGYVEILVDNEWKTLGMISMASEYYNREVFDLSEYKGKIVTLRWRYAIVRGSARRGLSLDNILIESTSGVMAYFNATEWAVGKINYDNHIKSRKALSLINGGLETLTVKDIEFVRDNIACTIEGGEKIKSNAMLPFELDVMADSIAGDYRDTLTVNFTNGQSISLPITYTSLDKDMLYFNFDFDEHGTLNPVGLTTVDKDRYSNHGSAGINWPNEATPYAYCVINVDAQHSDWRNVYPISGNQVLSACAPYGAGDNYSSDWLISPKLKATKNSSFSFWGKSYGTDDEYNDFKPHYYEIWVSTTDDKLTSFKQVTERKAISKNDAKWYEYTTDLSAYAGQDIYVALVHCANDYGYIAFFDDLMYSHFGEIEHEQQQPDEDPDDKPKPDPDQEGLTLIHADGSVQKILMNGEIVILRGDKRYNVQGIEL